MVGNHSLWFDQLDRSQCVIGAHREVVADGQNRDVDTLFTDQLHVVEQAGVARVVNRSIVRLQQDAARISAVRTVRQRGTVMSDRQLDGSKVMLVRSTNVLRMHVLDALLRQPLGNFEIRDDQATGPFGNLDRIANMVTMTVRDDQRVRCYRIGRRCGCRIAREERINNDRPAARLDRESSVSQPGDFGAHRVALVC